MAKGSNLLTHRVRGKLGNFQLVKDPRYGEYLRCARGTLKPALLNEACAASSARLVTANAPAKAIYQAIRSHHKDYFLWNRLVSVFRGQLKAGIPFHLKDLTDMECHREYRLEKLMECSRNSIAVTATGGAITVDITQTSHPDWSYLKWARSFQYRLSVIVVCPDLATGNFSKEIAHGPVVSFTEPVQPLSLQVNLPDLISNYLVFLLAEIVDEGKVVELERTKGMRLIAM